MPASMRGTGCSPRCARSTWISSPRHRCRPCPGARRPWTWGPAPVCWPPCSRAADCAQENIRRLGLEGRVTVLEADLFPPGRADLVVCNPPWLPGAATSALELGIYDDASSMLRGFLDGLPAHLRPGGEAWLILA